MPMGSGRNDPWRILPIVVSKEKSIATTLALLQGMPIRTAKSFVHLISAAASPSGDACIYLGRLGLLGGVQEQQIEWIAGPHMDMDSGGACREDSYNIPAGYRYKGYRIKPGAIVRRASCTIRYVEANLEEEIKRYVDLHGEKSTTGQLTTDIPNVATLGSIEGGCLRRQNFNERMYQTFRMRHAAVVLYGKTKPNKPLRPPSKIKIEVEIGVMEVSSSSEDFKEEPTPSLPLRLVSRNNITLAVEDGPSAEAPEALSGASIDLLKRYTKDGRTKAQQISGKDVVVVLGDAYTERTTFINYLIGNDATLENRRDAAHQDPSTQCSYIYCHCPTFLDSKCPELKIANVINIRRALQVADSVRLIMLTNYESLTTGKGSELP